MFYFNKRLNNIIINCSPIIYCKLDPNDDTKIIFYLETGEQVTETYNTSELAAEQLEIYRKALEGSREYDELIERIRQLTAQVITLQGEKRQLEGQIQEQDDIISRATELSQDILV